MALYDLGKAHFRLNSDDTFEYLGKIIKREFFSEFNKDLSSCKYSFSKNDLTVTNVIVVDYLRGTFKEIGKKIIYTQEEKIAYEKEKQDNAFKLDPHEFPFHRRISGVRTPSRDDEVNTILSKTQSLLHDDLIDEFQYRMSYATGIPSKLLFGRDIPKPKNRIPDRVVFNEDKGKVTVLISKFNDGVAPYRAYTSKVHDGDKYSGYFGFFLSYYKYLNRHLDNATRKELIDMAFEHGEHKEYIIEGAVSQEVLKLVKLDEWDNILNAILEVSKQGTGYWDYAEWKEMLRVHELETKREKQREVAKEIKKHQKAIEELKKKEV